MCGQCIEINTTFTLLQSQAYEQDDNDSLFSYNSALQVIRPIDSVLRFAASQDKEKQFVKTAIMRALFLSIVQEADEPLQKVFAAYSFKNIEPLLSDIAQEISSLTNPPLITKEHLSNPSLLLSHLYHTSAYVQAEIIIAEYLRLFCKERKDIDPYNLASYSASSIYHVAVMISLALIKRQRKASEVLLPFVELTINLHSTLLGYELWLDRLGVEICYLCNGIEPLIENSNNLAPRHIWYLLEKRVLSPGDKIILEKAWSIDYDRGNPELDLKMKFQEV